MDNLALDYFEYPRVLAVVPVDIVSFL